MKKVLLIVLCFLCTVVVFAKERESVNKKTKWFVGPSVGVSWGEFGEYLYDSNDTYVCSKLLWEAKPLYNVGLNAGVERGKFLFEISQDFSLPLPCGKMYDSDWNKDGVKHTYSENENKLLLGLNTNVQTNYEIDINDFFSIKPSLFFNYNYYSFLASNGHGWYGKTNETGFLEDISWDNEDPKAKYYSKLSRVSYYRHTFNIYIGTFLCYNINVKNTLSVGLFTNVYTYTSAFDYHYDDANTNQDFFMQPIQNSFFNNFTININYERKIKNNFDLFFSLFYEKGFLIKGFMVTDYFTKDIYISNQKSGSDFFLFNTTLGFKYKF